MANEAKTDRTPYASLSKMLGYSRNSIHMRYNKTLKQGCNHSGAYTNEENSAIMLALFQKNKNAQNQYSVQDDIVWENLSKILHRTPHNIYKHWEGVIRPSILMFENGMENVDFRPILIDYFVENGIKFRSEIKWSEIMKDERFIIILYIFYISKVKTKLLEDYVKIKNAL